MFARVQTFHQPEDKLDELARVTTEQLEAGTRPDGLIGYEFLIDREAGKALLVSFWAHEADLRKLEAGNAVTRAMVSERTGVEPPASEIFEVLYRSSL